MSWPAWSKRLWLLTFLAALNMAASACGKSWPQVYGVADSEFATRERTVRSIDVLPVDLQVWTAASVKAAPETLRRRLEATSSGQLSAQLAARGYTLGANLDWAGGYQTGEGTRVQAMSPTEVIETSYALSSYGRAVAQAKQGLLAPHLPHRLGRETGSDATLYVGGWAYVGKRKSSTGSKVAKGVLIAVLIVAIVAVVVILAKEGGGGGGKIASGAAQVGARTGKVAVKVASGMARAVARGGLELSRGALHASGDILEAMARADYYGHTHTHISVSGGRPNYYSQKDTPRAGHSQMYVEMTLVDNRTGATLWHARQRFPAHAESGKDVRAVMKRMLLSLPDAR